MRIGERVRDVDDKNEVKLVAATFAEVMNQDKHDEPDCAEIEGVDYGNGNASAQESK